MPERVETSISRALFSLGTGLEVAVGQRTLQAVERTKQASVLFDEIVVESGLHIVEMTPERTVSARKVPMGLISPDLLRNTRTVETGTTSGVGVRRVGDVVEIYMGTNLPRLDDCSYTESPVAYRYVCEYHSELLDDLARSGADWVKVVSITGGGESGPDIIAGELSVLQPAEHDELEPIVLRLAPHEIAEFAEQLAASADEARQQPAAHARRATQPHVDDYVLVAALTEALQVADKLDAVPALSSAFHRVAAERGVPLQLPGVESLGFLVPNFSVLPWEEIARFRDHAGSVEARGRLREFESEVATRELPGSSEYVRSTGRAITDALLGAARDLAPSLPDDMRGPVLGTAIGLVPIVGQFASLAVSMGDIISAVRVSQAFEGSWVAAVFELRDAAADAAIDW